MSLEDSKSEIITLRSTTEQGDLIEALFVPSKGMKLMSFKKNQVETIENGSGLLIGPHCGQRYVIPTIKEESFKSHQEKMFSFGYKDPLFNGIGRYASWHCTQNEKNLSATLKGKDNWNEIPMATLEGQPFQMHMDATLTHVGLIINLSVVSESDSVVGIDFHYRLPNKKGSITSDIQKEIFSPTKPMSLPQEIPCDEKNKMHLELSQAIEYAFMPFPNPLEGKILLETSEYRLLTTYRSKTQENSWILHYMTDASYVSISPMSAKNPWHPNLTVSSIQIHLQIL